MILEDKIAIVTGGAQSIGEAICRAYAKEGATVIIADKNQALAEKVAAQIQQARQKASAIMCDVSQPDSVTNLIQQVIAKHGRIDILMSNAGVVSLNNVEDQTPEDWDYVINTNLKGAFLLSRLVVPLMKKQQYGKIIFMSCTSGMSGFPTIVPFAASKGGLVAMCKSLVAEVAKYNINVNCISPDVTDTPINQAILKDKGFLDMLAQRTATGQALKPQDITGAAVFLASDAARGVHGLDLLVDNGWCNL